MFDKQKSASKFSLQGFGLVFHHRQTAAFIRAIFGEGGNDHMTARANCTHDPLDISMAISRVSQEMEHRAVVPNIEPVYGKLCAGNIAFHPVHVIRMLAQTLLCDSKRR